MPRSKKRLAKDKEYKQCHHRLATHDVLLLPYPQVVLGANSSCIPKPIAKRVPTFSGTLVFALNYVYTKSL
jgi:hypothetical protein